MLIHSCKRPPRHAHKTVKHGEQVYEALKDTPLGWLLYLPASTQSIRVPNYNTGDARGLPSNISLIGIGGGKRLFTYAKSLVLPRLWVVETY